MERKTQLRPADSSQNLPLQSYNAGFKWIWQPKNETLVFRAAVRMMFGHGVDFNFERVKTAKQKLASELIAY